MAPGIFSGPYLIPAGLEDSYSLFGDHYYLDLLIGLVMIFIHATYVNVFVTFSVLIQDEEGATSWSLVPTEKL